MAGDSNLQSAARALWRDPNFRPKGYGRYGPNNELMTEEQTRLAGKHGFLPMDYDVRSMLTLRYNVISMLKLVLHDI